MTDRRKHRGAHPEDGRLFTAQSLPRLRAATRHLSWLLTEEFPIKASLKLVGDRHGLDERQRAAVQRCACSDASLSKRGELEVAWDSLAGESLHIDGFNLLTTIEVALSGGVILGARDGCYRDIAGVHGTWRRVDETGAAIKGLGALLESEALGGCIWYLDRPVSNSGRLKKLIEEAASAAGWAWDVRISEDPDRDLIASGGLVASADSVILEGASRWLNLVRRAVDVIAPEAWVVDLGDR